MIHGVQQEFKRTMLNIILAIGILTIISITVFGERQRTRAALRAKGIPIATSRDLAEMLGFIIISIPIIGFLRTFLDLDETIVVLLIAMFNYQLYQGWLEGRRRKALLVHNLSVLIVLMVGITGAEFLLFRLSDIAFRIGIFAILALCSLVFGTWLDERRAESQ